MKEKAIFCWSGGKDSTLALYKVLQENTIEVIGLLTTINKEHKRVSMHGIREELVEEQARQTGIPLIKMYISTDTSNTSYEKAMEEMLLNAKASGVSKVIFGDIFLEDLKKYREDNLKKVGLEAVFPLWKQDTSKLVHEFVELGFKTIICSCDSDLLGEKTVGRIIDKTFINDLPTSVDPCGENGEFHSFAFEGPLFKSPIKFSTGEKILKHYDIKTTDENGSTSNYKKGYWFIELQQYLQPRNSILS